jgi:hypothetical protein
MLMMYVSPVASQSKESSPVPREGGWIHEKWAKLSSRRIFGILR